MIKKIGRIIEKNSKGANEPRAQTACAYPCFHCMRYAREYCYSPLDGKLVHRRITPQRYVAGTHLYTWVKRDKVEKNPLSKETTRQAKLELRTSRSEVRGVNRSATHASTYDSPYFLKYSVTFLNRANTDRFVSPRVLVSVYLSPG